MRLEEINRRLAEIKSETEQRGEQMSAEDLKKLKDEADKLIAERKQIMEQAEQRTQLLSAIAAGSTGTPVGGVLPTAPDTRAPVVDVRETPEYRVAWLKQMQGKDLSDAEKRDLNSGAASVGSVVPIMTQNEIITKIKETCPLLDEITLLHVAGNVTFAVENSVADAAVHTENGLVTASSDTLVSVNLAGYEIVKTVRISKTVKTMSVNAFEQWLVDMLTDKIAYAIEDLIVNGTGTNEPKGIKNATTYTDTVNGVDFAGTHITYAELIELISYLPSRHARTAKFYMHRTTMWQELANIRDDGKYPVLKDEGGGKWSCMGYMIVLSDAFTTGEIYFGNAKMIVGNLAEDVNVAASEHSGFNYNAIDYRGAAIFDCDCADAAAFVKGAASL